MDITDILPFLRSISIFALLTESEVAQLLETAELKSFSNGDLVYAAGDEDPFFYIVYSGRVRILRANAAGVEMNLGVRSRGDHFGEQSVTAEGPCVDTARAIEDCAVLAIRREAIITHLLARGEIREQFDKFVRSMAIHRFLTSCANLAQLAPAEIQELIRRLHSEYFKEGEAVFRQGAAADKFYLIESGRLKVVAWQQQSASIINYLREGDFFGERALLVGAPRAADVVCLTDCHLYSLSKADFDELVARSATWRHVLEDRLQSYGRHPPPIPYQEIIKQELAALKAPQVKPLAETPGPAPQAAAAPRRAPWRRRVFFPFIRQHDETACGSTCLMMIARFYGKNFSSSRVRDLAHVDISGSSLANLAGAAEQLGFATRGVRLGYDDLAAAPLPAVVHWQGCHFVVVYRMTDQWVWVADPALGLRKYSRAHFEKNWTGIALLLEPTPVFGTQPEDKTTFRNFLPFIAPYRGLLLEILLASILLNLFGLATPIFTQNIVDHVLTHNNVSMLNLMFAGMLLVVVFQALVGTLRQYLIVHVSLHIDLRMLVSFYKHLLALPLGYFKARRIGDFISRFGENQKIRDFMTHTALTLVLDAVLVVLYLTLMFYYNPRMAGLTCVFIPIFVAVTLGFTPVLRRLNVDAFAARTDAESLLIESINGIDTVKAMNVEYPTRWKWENKFIHAMSIDFRLFHTGIGFYNLASFVGALSSAVLLWYGARQVIALRMSVGELMAFMALLGSVLTPINRILNAWDDIQQTLVSVDRLNDVLNARTEFPAGGAAEGILLREPRGELVFKDVYFRYGGEDDPYILSQLNLRVPAGQVLALVGRSGSGKTTLATLVARLYDPTDGQVLLDGCDLRNLNLTQLRRLIGYVPQDSYLFNGTISENIALGDPDLNSELVMRAAQLANAHDFINGLPLGYQTKIGESGLRLSGGQKQRICIARALYRDPQIIILDEATSSLDTESEQALQKSMGTILKNRTALVIAHRLSTIRNADHIVVLDNGTIVEQGTHADLMRSRGLYHYLNHQQLEM